MKTFETILVERKSCRMRVKAETEEEAHKIFSEFVEKDPEYCAVELDNSTNGEWTWGPFEEVTPHDEAATISRNGDNFDAVYDI